MKKSKIALLGGDARQLVIAESFVRRGAYVWVYGDFDTVSDKAVLCDTIEEAVQNCESLILPMPFTRDSVYLNFGADSEKKIKIQDIFKIAKGKVVLAGNIPPIIKEYASREKIRLIDYYDSEELKIKNAYLTAEGAVSIAMQKLDIALNGAKTAVTGFGRIASPTACILKKLGADVTVAARKDKDLALAQTLGYKTLKIGLDKEKKSTLAALSKSYDVIFNTVPSWIFDEEFFRRVSPKTLIIELASAPGGFDVTLAQRYGANFLSAQGIPGKYAPVNAGQLIFESIEKILEKEMVL